MNTNVRDEHVQRVHDVVISDGVRLLGGLEDDHVFLVDIEEGISRKGGGLMEAEPPLRNGGMDLRHSESGSWLVKE